MSVKIEKGDAYKDLFASVVAIFKIRRKRDSYLYRSLIDSHIKTNYISSSRVLKLAMDLIYDAQGGDLFDFLIEFEINRYIMTNKSITEDELLELMLTKELTKYIQKNDSDSVYILLNYVCNSDIRNELVPTDNWFDL